MSEPATRTRSARWKRWGAIGAAVLLGLFAAYGAGRLQTRMRVGEVQAQFEGMRNRFEVADRERLQLEARRQLDLALGALERRNFGTAQTHLREASAKLRRASPESPAAGKLSQDIDGVALKASEDVAQHRGKVEALIVRFDREIAAEMSPEQ